jgi:hypothetical protein
LDLSYNLGIRANGIPLQILIRALR